MDLQADHKRKRTDVGRKEKKRPRTADQKRKRTDEGKKEKKRPRTAAVDETFHFQSNDVASGGHPRKERRRRPDVGNTESSRKRKVDLIKDDNMFDRSTEASVDEARKIHAMQRLMSAVDGLMSAVDGESTPEDKISLTDEIEYFNKIHDKIVDLKQKIVVELKQKSLKRRRKANWSELPNELLESILKKLIPCEFDIAGFRHIREFKAVCQSWRTAAKSCSSYVPLPRTPCLLLHGNTPMSFLIDPIGRKEHTIRNVHDYCPNARCVGSSYGWIVMFYREDNLEDWKAHLFNPITRASIPIPGTRTLPEHCHCRTPSKAIISSNPSFNKNFVVVVKFRFRLAYYKHGDEDKSWKMLSVKDADVKGADYYDDKGFVFHDDLLVASCETVTNVWDFKEYPPLLCNPVQSLSDAKPFTYLMESSLTGDILRLIKERKNKTLKFSVEKLNLQEDGKWENLQSLGDQNLFFFFCQLSGWQLMSLTNPSFLGCEKNSIYFAARELDKYATLDKYVRYDLEKGKVKSVGEEGTIMSFREDVHINLEPLWIIPNPW